MDITTTARPDARLMLRPVRLLVAGYLGLSLLTLVAILVLRNVPAAVNSAVWIRATIVLASALLTSAFARAASRGSGRAYLRLRIVSAVMLVAIMVIVAAPGPFPLWLKGEQSLCGVLLLGVVLLVNRKWVRRAFAGVRDELEEMA